VTWTEPTTWKKITINGVQGWWICAEITAFTSKTTLPLGTQAWLYAVDKDFNNYEIRFDTEFGVKSENQIYTPAEGHTWKWEKFIEWAAARGLTEGEQRSITIYIKARDSYKNYSENYGSIVLINTAPDMSATTITAKAVIHNNRRDVIIGWSAYIEPSDITKYTVYGSPTNPCPLVAGNIKAIVGKGVDSVIVKGLPYVRGVSWDWRVRPSDIYGDGTASD
jgi:hypothetical protein